MYILLNAAYADFSILGDRVRKQFSQNNKIIYFGTNVRQHTTTKLHLTYFIYHYIH